ncbi:MAG: hypothetical protein KDE33_23735 [Bacteroidetes bacterium]|nr:hypothetical protein [Bacteroidota bacterium]
MRHVTHQIQDLLEGLESLRTEQKLILHRNEIQDDSNLQNLPPADLKTYQRLTRERKAKGEFLAKIAGTKDDLKILLGQLSRLSEAREKLLKNHQVKSPLDLPLSCLTEYTDLWGKSDWVAGLIERILENGNC